VHATWKAVVSEDGASDLTVTAVLALAGDLACIQSRCLEECQLVALVPALGAAGWAEHKRLTIYKQDQGLCMLQANAALPSLFWELYAMRFAHDMKS